MLVDLLRLSRSLRRSPASTGAAVLTLSLTLGAGASIFAGSLATLEASDGTNLTLRELGAAERVSGSNVTPRFLTLLGVTPALGRAFHLDDVGQRVVIIRRRRALSRRT